MEGKYKNTALSAHERAEDLLSRLNLEEKMAQVQCVLITPGMEDKEKANLTSGIGEVSCLEVRGIKTASEAAAWQRKIQKMIMENSRFHIPAIFHMEGLCGAMMQGAMSFPSGIGRASSFDDVLEEKIANIAARQEQAAGITHTLAPVLDISRDSRMGRQGETYGEDPMLAAKMGTAYVRGIQKEHVDGRSSEAVAKHFMGFHNSLGGIHGAASETPRRLLMEVYGKPFQAAIAKAKMRGIMPCYCTIDGEPASCSKWLLNDVLRDEMGFDGLAVSDYSAVANIHNVQHVYENIEEAGFASMSAGMDVEMPIKAAFGDRLLEMFRSGKADISVLDRAVMRVLCAKFRMGLFEKPFSLSDDTFQKEFFNEKDSEISLQSARESMILLKNNGVLPLKSDVKKIAVIGCHADNAASFFGGYTHVSFVEATKAAANSIAGIGDFANNSNEAVKLVKGTQIQSSETEEFYDVLKSIKPECKSLYRELKERLPESEVVYAYGYPIAGYDDSHFDEALAACEGADICILTLGGKHGSCSVASMGEGVDGTNINLPECQDIFIKKAGELATPLVGIHFDGRPISSDIADNTLDAIIEAWNPSEMGAKAVVDTLLGINNPSGKLPVCVARSTGQIPVFYNHPNGSCYHQGESIGFANYVDMPHEPRYYFGHGLSYTTFEYKNLILDKSEVEPEDSVWISLTVKNTGKMTGTEVVQLYIKDVYSRIVRPVLELAGFVRIELLPGEEKNVAFKFFPSQTAFWESGNKWLIEKGEIQIFVGASSKDLRLEGSFRITENRYISGNKREFWAEAL